ncbi:uncharacterized protein [Diabrotica undecimpunctata]|uniref:uncharacterized protein isoform X2 n=1 Tax=Diabrotica undecimpunctata TaxID=50387 RepID=UPI003B6368CB
MDLDIYSDTYSCMHCRAGDKKDGSVDANMSKDYFKKRLINQREAVYAQAQSQFTNADTEDDASHSSCTTSASTSQTEEQNDCSEKTEVEKKASYIDSRGHEIMQNIQYKSDSTSLCKPKRPYNIGLEENVQHPYENKQLNTGKHLLPAIIPELRSIRRKSSVSNNIANEQCTSKPFVCLLSLPCIDNQSNIIPTERPSSKASLSPISSDEESLLVIDDRPNSSGTDGLTSVNTSRLHCQSQLHDSTSQVSELVHKKISKSPETSPVITSTITVASTTKAISSTKKPYPSTTKAIYPTSLPYTAKKPRIMNSLPQENSHHVQKHQKYNEVPLPEGPLNLSLVQPDSNRQSQPFPMERDFKKVTNTFVPSNVQYKLNPEIPQSTISMVHKIFNSKLNFEYLIYLKNTLKFLNIDLKVPNVPQEQIYNRQKLAYSIISYMSQFLFNDFQSPILRKYAQDMLDCDLEKFRPLVETFLKAKPHTEASVAMLLEAIKNLSSSDQRQVNQILPQDKQPESRTKLDRRRLTIDSVPTIANTTAVKKPTAKRKPKMISKRRQTIDALNNFAETQTGTIGNDADVQIVGIWQNPHQIINRNDTRIGNSRLQHQHNKVVTTNSHSTGDLRGKNQNQIIPTNSDNIRQLLLQNQNRTTTANSEDMTLLDWKSQIENVNNPGHIRWQSQNHITNTNSESVKQFRLQNQNQITNANSIEHLGWQNRNCINNDNRVEHLRWQNLNEPVIANKDNTGPWQTQNQIPNDKSNHFEHLRFHNQNQNGIINANIKSTNHLRLQDQTQINNTKSENIANSYWPDEIINAKCKATGYSIRVPGQYQNPISDVGFKNHEPVLWQNENQIIHSNSRNIVPLPDIKILNTRTSQIPNFHRNPSQCIPNNQNNLPPNPVYGLDQMDQLLEQYQRNINTMVNLPPVVDNFSTSQNGMQFPGPYIPPIPNQRIPQYIPVDLGNQYNSTNNNAHMRSARQNIQNIGNVPLRTNMQVPNNISVQDPNISSVNCQYERSFQRDTIPTDSINIKNNQTNISVQDPIINSANYQYERSFQSDTVPTDSINIKNNQTNISVQDPIINSANCQYERSFQRDTVPTDSINIKNNQTNISIQDPIINSVNCQYERNFQRHTVPTDSINIKNNQTASANDNTVETNEFSNSTNVGKVKDFQSTTNDDNRAQLISNGGTGASDQDTAIIGLSDTHLPIDISTTNTNDSKTSNSIVDRMLISDQSMEVTVTEVTKNGTEDETVKSNEETRKKKLKLGGASFDFRELVRKESKKTYLKILNKFVNEQKPILLVNVEDGSIEIPETDNSDIKKIGNNIDSSINSDVVVIDDDGDEIEVVVKALNETTEDKIADNTHHHINSNEKVTDGKISSGNNLSITKLESHNNLSITKLQSDNNLSLTKLPTPNPVPISQISPDATNLTEMTVSVESVTRVAITKIPTEEIGSSIKNPQATQVQKRITNVKDLRLKIPPPNDIKGSPVECISASEYTQSNDVYLREKALQHNLPVGYDYMHVGLKDMEGLFRENKVSLYGVGKPEEFYSTSHKNHVYTPSGMLLRKENPFKERTSVRCLGHTSSGSDSPSVVKNSIGLLSPSVSTPRIRSGYASSENDSQSVIKNSIGLLSPLAPTPRINSMEKWKTWMTEEKNQDFLKELDFVKNQSVETISNAGSDYSPPISHFENDSFLKINSTWYRVKKNVVQSIPKGKLSYDRESHWLRRYFDDKQLEQFLENADINSVVASDYLKHVRNREGAFLTEKIYLTPFEFPENNEIIQLPREITFCPEEVELKTPEMYVEEMEKVKKVVPTEFHMFYRYVTGYQILQDHSPISFLNFLTMHNTGGIQQIFEKFLKSLLGL